MRDVSNGEGGEGRDGGAGVPGDGQAISAMRRCSDAGRGLDRRAAYSEPTFSLSRAAEMLSLTF